MSGPLAGISFIAGIGGSMAWPDSPYPRPRATPSEVRTYFTENAGAARLSATLQVISTICLARFTASVARLAGSRTLRAAAVAGGGVATASVGDVGAVQRGALRPLGAAGGQRRQLHRLGFRAGGSVHGAGFGLLCGALALAGLRRGELPRLVAATGLASAGAGLLAPLYFRRAEGSVVHSGRALPRPDRVRDRGSSARPRTERSARAFAPVTMGRLATPQQGGLHG